jgi:hypothetical protein
MGADRPIADPETLRLRMSSGSLNLRGVAGMLRRLVEGMCGPRDEETANILRLLARAADDEADAMGEAEVFLLGQAKEGA